MKNRMRALALGLIGATSVAVPAFAVDLNITCRCVIGGVNSGTAQWIEESVIPAFEAAHPDINVTLDVVSDFVDEVTVRAVSGLLSDVTILNWGTLGLVERGFFLDLTPYVERDGVDLDDYLLQTNLAIYQGRVIGLPWGTFAPLMFYNKDLFDQSGVGYVDATWNWDDLQEAAKRLVRRGGDGEVSQWGLNNMFDEYEFGWRSFVAQNGGSIYDEEITRTRIAEPEAVEAIRFLMDLVQRELVPPLGRDVNFRNWDIAMEIRHPSGPMSAFARDPIDWRWGIEIAPMGRERAASMNTLIAGVNAKSEHPDAAWRLVKYLGSVEAAKQFALLGRALPSHKGAYGDSEFYRVWGEIVGTDLTHLAQSMPLHMAHPFWMDVHLKEGEIKDPVWDRLGRDLFLSNQDPALFLQSVAERVNGILNH